ncbi:MAG: hypothetical protein PUE91_07115 [Clostridiales bacterium]|nr:hypothetical protein [Clostridiales bacterium]
MICNIKENAVAEVVYAPEEWGKFVRFRELCEYVVHKTTDPDKLEAMWKTLEDAGFCD